MNQPSNAKQHDNQKIVLIVIIHTVNNDNTSPLKITYSFENYKLLFKKFFNEKYLV